MSRLSKDDAYTTEEIHDDNWDNLDISKENKLEKVILWDFDSILHLVLYSGYSDKLDDNGKKVRNPEYTEADLEMLQGKLTEMTLKILNIIESRVNILACYIVVKGVGNYRKDILPTYKAHRLPPNPLINKLYEYTRIAHQAISMDGCEAEDVIFTLSSKINHQGVILRIDSDLGQIPGIHFDYKKNIWMKISEEEALHNKYKKLCCADSGDNVKTTPGIGIAYFNKNFSLGMTVEQYEEALYKAHLKAWKNDEIKAKEQMELGKQLLTLKYMG
jgi:hypothetical protein